MHQTLRCAVPGWITNVGDKSQHITVWWIALQVTTAALAEVCGVWVILF